MKIFIVLNGKGGVGKTTTADNIAVGFARKGLKTLLVDYDPQGNTTDVFHNDGDFKFVEFIKEVSQIADYTLDQFAIDFEKKVVIEADISKALMDPTVTKSTILKTKYENLDLIPSTINLAKSDTDIRMDSITPQHNRLENVLEQVKNDYDVCILDCPPTINILTLNALIVGGTTIIPIKIDPGAVKGFLDTLKNIRKVLDNWPTSIRVKILFTMVNRTNIEKTFIELMRRLCQKQVYETTIRYQSKAITESSFDAEVVIDNPKHNVAQDYLTLVDEIMKEDM